MRKLLISIAALAAILFASRSPEWRPIPCGTGSAPEARCLVRKAPGPISRLREMVIREAHAAATKSLSTYIAAATSNTAGSTKTGTAIDHTADYGGLVTAKITNGATGPTVAADVVLYVSGDNSNFKTFARVTSQTGNNTVTEFAFVLPPPTMYSRVDVTGNTAQAVTCEAFVHRLTGI